MPTLEPKEIQKELESQFVWPVYWIFGTEQMKIRELLKRIKNTTLGPSSAFSFNENSFSGDEADAQTIVDAAQNLSLGSNLNFITIHHAEALKDLDTLHPLLQPRGKVSDVPSVCVFISKDLDKRKKFVKSLLQSAAVVPCEDIVEQDREAWIKYLCKRRDLQLDSLLVTQLISVDPWSLDLIDQELEKYQTALIAGTPETASEVMLGQIGSQTGGTSGFLDDFFRRKIEPSLQAMGSIAENPSEAIPLLGLLSWNVRQLALLLSDKKNKTQHLKLNPYIMERLDSWARFWSLEEIAQLQSHLARLDFSLKQTPKLPLGLWAELCHSFLK